VAWIVVTECIGYTDNWTFERIVGIAAGLDERLAQEQRKTGVSITGQPFA
jgi:hypothetical protein